MALKEQRQSPSGPKTVLVRRGLFTPPSDPIPANDFSAVAVNLFLGTDVKVGDAIAVTGNDGYPGLVFKGTIIAGDPVGVGVQVCNYTGAPIAQPPDGYDLTIVITKGVSEAPTP